MVDAEWMQMDMPQARSQMTVEDDPMWDSDWSQIGTPEGSQIGTPEAQPPMMVEVFELHGMPAWLARLQRRQERAGRAGKSKLARRLGKEIADSWAEYSASDPSYLLEAADVAEGVYGLDWSSALSKKANNSMAS